jgi:transposase-like protein
MNIQEQIKKLFERLSPEERVLILEKLNKTDSIKIESHNDTEIDTCPYCSSTFLSKNGHRGDTQRYKCKACHKTFTSISGSCFHGIKKKRQFEEYSKLMFEQYYTIETMAKKIGISVQTSFDWRHKILSGLNAESKEFNGITEIDDVWFLYSQKGRQGLKYSRTRGGSKRKGDNKFQVKMLITADRQTTKDFAVTKIGRISKSDLERKVGGKFNKSCTLVSDKHRSISAFAKSEHLPHVNFKASEHTAGGEFHVQNVNNLASRVKTIVNHQFRGVSTKYLQNYSNWFAMNEKMKLDEDRNLKLRKEMECNKNGWGIFTNIEAYYKDFIENLSERTYRCPTKRNWSSTIQNKDFIGANAYL